MTKQEMLDAIYTEMGIYQGPDSAPAVEFEPVRIGNVLKYIDMNCCFKEPSNDGLRERDMLELDKMLRSVFYAFVGKQDRPIEEQDDYAISFVYNLIKK